MARSSLRGSGGDATATSLRKPLEPTVVTPTPASSTASTVAIDSASSSSSSSESDADDRDERIGFLTRSPPPRKSRRHRSHTKTKRGSREARQQQRSRHSQQHQHQLYAFERDLERGDDDDALARAAAAAAHEWQVVRELRAPCASQSGGGAVLQLVELKRANFGFRWRGAAPEAPTCMVGPHWWLMGSTFTVFLAAALVVTALTAPSAGFGEAITGVLLSSACLGMYAMVGCANPGIVERIEDPPDDSYSYCDHCDSYRPEGALHCMDCRVCVEGYDHHCPWTGKCVGRGNVRYFYAWLFFLVLAFVYEVIEFTTYILPPEDQPPGPTFFDDDNDDSVSGGGVGDVIRAAATRVVDALGPH